jgi:hypothetical protein
MPDEPAGPDDVLSGLPRKRPQRSNARREAARAKAAKGPAKSAAKAATNGTARKPKAVKTPPQQPAAPARPAAPGRTDQSPAELAAAAVKATGELIELGGKVLKGVLGRLPRP